MYYGIDYENKTRNDKIKEDKKGYKVFLPIPKGKVKASIRGFWYSQGRLYYDYITVKRYKKVDYKLLEYLKTVYKQEAIFYTSQGKAYIYHSISKIEVLRSGRYIRVKRQEKSKLRAIIKQFKGATVHNSKGDYILEIWGG